MSPGRTGGYQRGRRCGQPRGRCRHRPRAPPRRNGPSSSATSSGANCRPRPRPAATLAETATTCRPHRRSPARRLDRRSRGPAGQPRRRRPETRQTEAALKLSSVLTDLHGVTGRDIMNHLIAGERTQRCGAAGPRPGPPQDPRAGAGTGGRESSPPRTRACFLPCSPGSTRPPATSSRSRR